MADEKRYEALIRISDAIRSGANRDLFDLLAAELESVVPFHTIGHFDAIRGAIRWRVQGEELTIDPMQGFPLRETVVWNSYHRQETIVIPSVPREIRFGPAVAMLNRLGVFSLCAIPLTTPHRKLGGLVFTSPRENGFPPEEVRFLELSASQIALAMDDAWNFREAQQAAQRVELLLDLSNRIISSLDLRELLHDIGSNVCRVMNCDSAGVALPDPVTGRLQLRVMEPSTGIRNVLDDPPPGLLRVFSTGEMKVLDAPDIETPRLWTSAGAATLCYFPIVGRKRILGAATVASSRPRAFSPDDISFLRRIVTQTAIAVENAYAYGEISALKDKLAREKIYLEDEIRSELHFDEIIGSADSIRHVLRQVETVAPTESTVLIYGETGTGKELIARALHERSGRHAEAFVKLNCAAIPTGLLESELFGHERGAFTGAIAQRIGRFELADKGTIFLDEIGEIPLELQPKLLRVLQEREFERLGGTRTLRTGARLIAATNRDLAAMTAAGTFRADLYYRLEVFPIRLPPLRERTVDIPLLVRHFAQQYSRRNGRHVESIPARTMEALVQYHWPGNIRELQNVIERAVILSKGSVLEVPLSALEASPSRSHARPAAPSESLRQELDAEERRRILEALELSGWTVAGPNGAAARLGMKRSTLQFRMNRLGIQISKRAGLVSG